MNIYAVIMAGGVGSRFWPRSKKKTPKQLLKIIGEQTMIQETVARLNGIVKNENIYIITNKIQMAGVLTQLPELPVQNAGIHASLHRQLGYILLYTLRSHWIGLILYYRQPTQHISLRQLRLHSKYFQFSYLFDR